MSSIPVSSFLPLLIHLHITGDALLLRRISNLVQLLHLIILFLSQPSSTAVRLFDMVIVAIAVAVVFVAITYFTIKPSPNPPPFVVAIVN